MHHQHRKLIFLLHIPEKDANRCLSHLKVAFDRQSSCRFKTWHSFLQLLFNVHVHEHHKGSILHPSILSGSGRHEMAFIEQPKNILCSTSVQLELLLLITSTVKILLKQTPYIVLCDQLKYNRLKFIRAVAWIMSSFKVFISCHYHLF